MMNTSQNYPFYQELKDGIRKTSRRPNSLSKIVVVILCVGVLLTVLNIYQLQQMKEEHNLHFQQSIVEGTVGKGTKHAPVVWMYAKRMETGYLKHVKAVFDRLGFIHTNGDEDWDVMWAHDYPFVAISKIMTRLRPHQKVNHFPGSGFITNKGSLATSQSRAIPRAFKIPKDKEKFLKHAKDHPEKMWVQKNNNHRGIKIRQLEELDFESEGSFVQEYVSKPLLIDERKFDIGVYTILTSLDPLRVYIVDDDALFRFCPKNYYPFHVEDVDKYVVRDDYTPMWEMPSLTDMYVNKGYSFKETFNRYMIKHGKNVTGVWNDIHETIRTIYLEKQKIMISSIEKYKNTRNFFEMVRFDFVLDENCKVYLMEVNMSPNLSTGHFPGNRRLYEHVVYNMLRLVGVASMVDNHFHMSDKHEEEMLVSDKEISVFSDWCMLPECEDNCDNMKCALCRQCLTTANMAIYKDAYLEHVNRGGCRRMFPPAMNQTTALQWSPDKDTFYLYRYREKTRHMFVWFIGMCKRDATFCI